MQVYELGYLILPSVPEENLPALVAKIKDILGKVSKAILDSEDPTKIELAYSMRKTVGSSSYVVNDAYLGWIKFEVNPEDISGLESNFRKTEEILRALIMKTSRETRFTFAKAREATLAAIEAKALEQAVVE